MHTYMQTDRQTDRQTYIHTYIHTFKLFAGAGPLVDERAGASAAYVCVYIYIYT